MAIRYYSKTKAQLVVNMVINGKQVRKTKMVQITGKRDARDQYIEFEKECKAQPLTADTVEQLLKDFIGNAKVRGVKETTLQSYAYAEKLINSKIGKVLAKELTPYQVESLITYMVVERKNSPKTVKNYISVLSSAYKYGIKNRILKDNPCSYVDLPKKKSKESVILSKDDVSTFMECLDNELLDFKVLCELALFCGLRRGEVLALTEKDINMEFGNVRIWKTRYRVKGKDIVQEPKTEKSRRVVQIPPFVLDDIKNLIAEHHGYEFDTDGYLIQYCGEKIKPDQTKKMITAFTKKYNLPPVTLHGLRHTFASMLNASGEFDIAVISAALGHSNISTTLNIYTHIFETSTQAGKRIANFYEEQIAEKGEEQEEPNAPMLRNA